MKIGIITDSTCDLPQRLLINKNIHIIPIKIINEENKDFILDDKTAANTSLINELINNKTKLRSQTIHSEEIKQFVLKILSEFDYDEIIFITPIQSKSQSYENIMFAVPKIMQEIRLMRANTDLKKTVKIEVLDSQQLSVGLGIIVSLAYYYRDKELTSTEILKKLKKIVSLTQTYLIPLSLSQLYSQTNEKGSKNVGLGSFLLGSALDLKPILLLHKEKTETAANVRGFDNALVKVLDMALTHIKKNTLSKNTIIITYSGDLGELASKTSFQNFQHLAKTHKIHLEVSAMSSTMTVNVGVGAFSLGLISEEIINII